MPFIYGECLVIKYGVVAQLVEHLTFNQVVGSSSLLSLSNVKSLESLILKAFSFFMSLEIYNVFSRPVETPEHPSKAVARFPLTLSR